MKTIGIKRISIILLAAVTVLLLLPTISEAKAEEYNGESYDGTIYYSMESDGSVTITDCDTSATSVKIPKVIQYGNVTKIADEAFKDCTKLQSITLCDNIKEIGKSAFYNCSSLESINITKNVKVIGECVFGYCTSLAEITVDSNNTGFAALNNCLVDIKAKVLIAGCKASVISDGGSITSIGDCAFFGCALSEIEIPKCVTNIGKNAFFGCTSLSSAHYNGRIKNLTVGDGNECLTAILTTNDGKGLLGDVNDDDEVTESDAVHLLFYTFFPEDYPVSQDCDFDGDGEVTESDAVYLLFYTLFPEDYPLH